MGEKKHQPWLRVISKWGEIGLAKRLIPKWALDRLTEEGLVRLSPDKKRVIANVIPEAP